MSEKPDTPEAILYAVLSLNGVFDGVVVDASDPAAYATARERCVETTASILNDLALEGWALVRPAAAEMEASQ